MSDQFPHHWRFRSRVLQRRVDLLPESLGRFPHGEEVARLHRLRRAIHGGIDRRASSIRRRVRGRRDERNKRAALKQAPPQLRSPAPGWCSHATAPRGRRRRYASWPCTEGNPSRECPRREPCGKGSGEDSAVGESAGAEGRRRRLHLWRRCTHPSFSKPTRIISTDAVYSSGLCSSAWKMGRWCSSSDTQYVRIVTACHMPYG